MSRQTRVLLYRMQAVLEARRRLRAWRNQEAAALADRALRVYGAWIVREMARVEKGQVA